MSESLTWLDHVLFAMVPFGIVAAITGAIRVQGPHIAKAFIGRIRENRALVEYELMSSTSHEVGEAFNGKGIVRVMGQPKIADFLIFPEKYEETEKVNEEVRRAYKEAIEKAEKVHEEPNKAYKEGMKVYKEASKAYNEALKAYHEATGPFSNSIKVVLGDAKNAVKKAEKTYDEAYKAHKDARESYKKAETTYREARGQAEKIHVETEKKRDPSCGIFSLNNVHRLPELMKLECRVMILPLCWQTLTYRCTDYRSDSYKLLQPFLDPFMSNKGTRSERMSDNVEQGEKERKLEPPNVPPNLQLNLASDSDHELSFRKRTEPIVTTILAVIIQTGLITLAATSVRYPPLRRSIGFEPKAYGLPCYIAGSLLLSLGVGICSYAVERNTTEYAWTLPEESLEIRKTGNSDFDPRLIFLQQRQSVNDQAFNAYAMFAGPKHEIITSARKSTRANNNQVRSCNWALKLHCS